MATRSYYDEHADEYYANTVGADLGELYDAFLPLVRPAGRILDAGCGSGRDSRAFLERGYDVTAFDASAELVARAARLLNLPVRHLRFQEADFREEFDGVWACASLLHVPRAEMDDALGRLARALVPGGAMFLSFKYGDREEERDGRLFNSYDEPAFRAMLARHPALEEIRLWTTTDVRPGRAGERWLDALVRRRSTDSPTQR